MTHFAFVINIVEYKDKAVTPNTSSVFSNSDQFSNKLKKSRKDKTKIMSIAVLEVDKILLQPIKFVPNPGSILICVLF